MVIQNIFLVLKTQLDAVRPKLLVRNALAPGCVSIKDYRFWKDLLIGLAMVLASLSSDGNMVSGCKPGVEAVSGDTCKQLAGEQSGSILYGLVNLISLGNQFSIHITRHNSIQYGRNPILSAIA